MNKFIYCQRTNESMPIFSASYTGVKGYIYVEAKSDTSLKAALTGIRDIFLYRKNGILRVPIVEMTSVFTIKNRKSILSVGQFVRFARGLYKGDLAVVDTLCGDGQSVIVKVVPRIAPQGASAKGKFYFVYLPNVELFRSFSIPSSLSPSSSSSLSDEI